MIPPAQLLDTPPEIWEAMLAQLSGAHEHKTRRDQWTDLRRRFDAGERGVA